MPLSTLQPSADERLDELHRAVEWLEEKGDNNNQAEDDWLLPTRQSKRDVHQLNMYASGRNMTTDGTYRVVHELAKHVEREDNVELHERQVLQRVTERPVSKLCHASTFDGHHLTHTNRGPARRGSHHWRTLCGPILK